MKGVTSHQAAAPAMPADFEEPACDLCGSTSRRRLYAYGDWRYGRPQPEYGVCVCRRCGLGYLSPRPTARAIGTHYPAEYDSGRSAADAAAKGRYAAQAEFVGAGAGDLLEVGTARGDFLDWVARLGWRATGIEPHARAGTTDPRVRHIDIHSPELAAGSFDVITAWHVVEHLHAPSTFFPRVAELLRPGGRFCMSVPQFDSYKSRWLKAEDVPRHLHFFTLKSLTTFGDRAGLRVARHSYSASFANGAEGHGAFTNYVYRWLGGLSLYDFHRLAFDRNRSLRREFPFLFQLARPLSWLERHLLTKTYLERSGKMGVIAVEFTKPAAEGAA